MCPGRCSKTKAGSPPPPAPRFACRCRRNCGCRTPSPTSGTSSAWRRRTRKAAKSCAQLLELHPDEPTLIIGMYVEQIAAVAGELRVPVITGTTSQKKRDQLYADFKAGRLRFWPCRRSPISPSTCRTPRWRSKSPAPSVRARKRPSDSAASCAPRRAAIRPTSIRWSAATRSNRTSPAPAFFLCEQGYAYEILDALDEQ